MLVGIEVEIGERDEEEEVKKLKNWRFFILKIRCGGRSYLRVLER